MFEDKTPPPKRKGRVGVVPEMTLPKVNPLESQAINGELTGDTEHDDAKESGAVLNLLKTVDAEASRVMGNGYWTALVFPDEETLQRFMALTGWDEFSEGLLAYTDGLAVAEKLGIKDEVVKGVAPVRFKRRRVDERLIREVGVYEGDES